MRTKSKGRRNSKIDKESSPEPPHWKRPYAGMCQRAGLRGHLEQSSRVPLQPNIRQLQSLSMYGDVEALFTPGSFRSCFTTHLIYVNTALNLPEDQDKSHHEIRRCRDLQNSKTRSASSTFILSCCSGSRRSKNSLSFMSSNMPVSPGSFGGYFASANSGRNLEMSVNSFSTISRFRTERGAATGSATFRGAQIEPVVAGAHARLRLSFLSQTPLLAPEGTSPHGRAHARHATPRPSFSGAVDQSPGG